MVEFLDFTCYTTHGASTVDYVLVSEGILDHILYLKVNDFIPCLSDCHCLIQWSISAKYSNEHVHIENCNTIEMSPGYKWSDESSFLFQEASSSPELKQRLDNFIQMGCRSNENEINNAATELANIIISAANKSLKRRNFTKNKKKNKNKKYFDTDLQILRINLTNYGKYFSKYPCDPRIRGHYYKLSREYNKVRKSKYRLYKKSLLHQIEMLHDKDPKQYWKLIEELKDTEKIDTTSSISTSTWQSHFQNLNNPKDIYKNRIKWLEDRLSQLEKIKCFTDIDGKITEAEINSAIKEMKSNKSTGLDGDRSIVRRSITPKVH